MFQCEAASFLSLLYDLDCQIIRTNNDGDTIWTKKFGDLSDHGLSNFISKSQKECVIQESQNINDTKTALYKINLDGDILDSVRIANLLKIVYSPQNYYIKVQNLDSSNVVLSKIYPDKLFF